MISILDEVKRDRERGAIELALFSINKALEMGEGDLIEFSKGIGEIREEMAPLVNIGRIINGKGAGEIKNILKEIKKKIQNGKDKIIKNAKPYITGKRCISISYSSTVIQTLMSIQPESVYWLKSLPGGEGEKSRDMLKKYGVQVEVIQDMEMAKVMEGIDVVLSGADAYSDNFVVNKLGTLTLFIIGDYYKKPRWVITHSLKKRDKIKIKNPIFEKVPIPLISGIITDEGVWKQQ